MSKPNGTKVERTRTFTGCRTCRSRHAKCDEAQPQCGTCQRLGLTCGGYGGRLFWTTNESAIKSEQQQSHRGSEYRYPLFSESDRQLMTVELSDSLGKKSTTNILADIDSACERFSNNAKSLASLVKGPFSVFPALEPPPPAEPQFTSSPNTDPSCGSVPSHDYDTDGFIEEIQRQDWDDQLHPDNLDLFAGPLDSAMAMDPSMTSFFLDSTSSAEGLALFSPNFIAQAIETESALQHAVAQEEAAREEAAREEAVHQEATRRDSPPETSSLCQTPQSQSSLPGEAQMLLRYYRDNMEDGINPIHAKRKSPWQIIFLPCALETFAEISLWNEASHTRTAILYALLAHSALQLHNVRKPNTLGTNWREIGNRHHERAQSHLRSALQLEMFGARQAKYKDLLMAILAMARTSLNMGTDSFRVFMLDAERLIRLRGLVTNNPFKTRMLHHMYTHLRVITESISMYGDVPTTGNGPQSSQLFAPKSTFRITEESLNMGLDPTQEKTDDIGFTDIHLEVQGRWTQTLYPIMYGIPESLMTLLSQTVSIANEKARLESAARLNPGISIALSHHVKTLENRIWAWSLNLDLLGPTKPPEIGTDPDSELIDHPHAQSMALAIQQALIIYFYRRVYDMNAMILQDQVRKTLDHLEPCMEDLIDDHDFATSLAWPAFVAACEAASPDLQERALKCLSATDDRGIYFTPKPAKTIVPMIWNRRKQLGDWTASWQTIMAEGLSC